jgi:WD40 repeat protein
MLYYGTIPIWFTSVNATIFLEETHVKTQLFLCISLLFISACSGAHADSATPTQIMQPMSSPTPIAESANVPTANVPISEGESGLPDAAGCTPALTPAGFFPGGERLLGFRENLIQIYNLKSRTIEVQFPVPARVVKAALSPDGQTIGVGLEDYSILLIHTSDQKVRYTLNAYKGNISGIVFSPAGDRLLIASEDTWVRTWSLDGQEVDAFQPTGSDNFPSDVMGIGISSDWKRLATIPVDGMMNLWSLPDHRLLGSFEGSIHGGYSGSQAAFSPDGQYLAEHLGAGGGYLSLWRIDDGELLLRGENITTGVDFSSDGRYMAYGEMLPAGGGHVVLRSPDGSQLFYDLTGPAGSMPAVPLFTPDGNMLVSGDYVSNALLAWNTADGQRVSLGEVNCQDQ